MLAKIERCSAMSVSLKLNHLPLDRCFPYADAIVAYGAFASSSNVRPAFPAKASTMLERRGTGGSIKVRPFLPWGGGIFQAPVEGFVGPSQRLQLRLHLGFEGEKLSLVASARALRRGPSGASCSRW